MRAISTERRDKNCQRRMNSLVKRVPFGATVTAYVCFPNTISFVFHRFREMRPTGMPFERSTIVAVLWNTRSTTYGVLRGGKQTLRGSCHPGQRLIKLVSKSTLWEAIYALSILYKLLHAMSGGLERSLTSLGAVMVRKLDIGRDSHESMRSYRC